MWTTETRQAADRAWISFKASRRYEREWRHRGNHEVADGFKRMADVAYRRWEAACRAAGMLGKLG